MQVLVLAVQNAVDYAVLGAPPPASRSRAASAARSARPSSGRSSRRRLRSRAAAACSRCARRAGRRRRAAHRRAGGEPAGAGPDRLRERLRERAATRVPRRGRRRRRSGSLLSLRLRERPLRDDRRDQHRASRTRWRRRRSPSSLAEIDRALQRALAGEQRRREFSERVAGARRRRHQPRRRPGRSRASAATASAGTLEMARAVGHPRGADRAGAARAARTRSASRARAQARLTPAGTAMADQLLSARREELRALLADHDAERAPEVQQLLERLCVELCGRAARPRGAPRSGALRRALVALAPLLLALGLVERRMNSTTSATPITIDCSTAMISPAIAWSSSGGEAPDARHGGRSRGRARRARTPAPMPSAPTNSLVERHVDDRPHAAEAHARADRREQVPPVQRAGEQEADVLEHVHAAVADGEVVGGRDVPGPDHADVQRDGEGGVRERPGAALQVVRRRA